MGEGKPYILLVEDEPDIAKLTADRISDLGYEIKHVSDTPAARAAIKESVPALILLDYKLPGENGLKFVESFKARGETCPPFIVMTGHSGEEIAVAMLRAGARDYLVKGVSFFDPLKSSVKRVLEELESARRLEASRLALKESEEKSKEAQRLARVGSWEWDAATDTITWSEEYYRLFSLEPAQPPPGYEAHLKAYTPESAARLDAAVKSSMRTGEPYELDLEFARPQGHCLWISARSAARRDAQGRTTGLYGTVQDITARKQAEEARKRLMAAIEQTGDGILISGPDGAIQYVNPAFEKVTGYSRGEVLGRNPRILKSGEQDQAYYRGLWETISSGRTWEGRMVNKRKDGTLYTVEATISPVRDAAGKIVNYVAVKKDITERLQLESRLRQSQKMEAVGLLAGGVAHDFNNILTAIKGYGALVTRALGPEDPSRKDMLEIMTAADRAVTLTRQLLAFSRKQIMVPQVIDLNKSLGDMVNMLRRIIGEDIRLKTELFSAPCLAKVDPGQMEQVIMNLTLNARDAIPKGGEITLETAILTPSEEFFSAHPDLARGRLACVKVRDNGCGMSPGEQRHLFEPFYTTKAPGKGTGLGLPVVFGIVKQSRGEIEVESTPGKGSTFSVYLPLAETPPPGEGKNMAGKHPATGHETVLLVEDEPSLRRLGERVLRESGYKVLAASDGQEALKFMEERGEPVDLLITDLVMPGMSGRELGKELARRKLTRRTLYMSGYTDDAISTHGVLEPGVAFIYKPFSVEALSDKIREVLDGPGDQAKA